MSAGRRPIAVLLVDDQPLVGAALGRLLATEPDIELHSCTRAADALTRATQLDPAIILQDLVMPDVDGLTMVGMFRGHPATALTPVVVLSGNDDADTRTRALAAGASEYLVKLPTKDDLVACIRRHATRPQAPTPAPNRSTGDECGGETLDVGAMAAFRQAIPGGSGDFVADLIDQFLHEAESRVATLRDAARCRDATRLRATAHSLKGSSKIIGAKRLAALCAQLEERSADTPAPDSSVLMAAIEEELVEVRDAFARARQSLIGS
jgi:DNA-binding response OmpR family regulator